MRGAKLMVMAVLVAAGGCEWVERQIDPPPPKVKTQKRSIVVLPFATNEALRNGRTIERDVCAAVAQELKAVLADTTIITPEAIAEWQDKNPGWRGMRAVEIGKELGAGMVVELNIVRFRTRERADSTLLQGIITAEIIVTEVPEGRILWRPAAPIQARWPKDTPSTTLDQSDDSVRRHVVKRFGEDFAAAFTDRFEE